MEEQLNFSILKRGKTMETNEIMNNEEFIEVTEEIATAGSGKGLKIVADIGLRKLKIF